MYLEKQQDNYLNKCILFKYETGCIPKNACCFCNRREAEFYWVYFKEPILGRRDIKLHIDVIKTHGIILPSISMSQI